MADGFPMDASLDSRKGGNDVMAMGMTWWQWEGCDRGGMTWWQWEGCDRGGMTAGNDVVAEGRM